MQPRQPGLPNLPKGALHVFAFGCALAVCAASYVGAYRPLGEWRQGVATRAEIVKAKLSQAESIRRQHAEKSAELEELLASVEAVGRRVPDRSREGEFLGDLSRIAETHGVKIDDFRRGRVDVAETHSAVSVTVEGKASYRGLCGLLGDVADLPRLASLTRLSVEPTGFADQYAVELQYLLYYGLNTDAAQADPRS